MKKTWKVIIAIIIILIIILGSMYIIDTIRMKNNEPVLFSTWGKNKENSNNEMQNLQEDLPKEYTLEQAVQEGCFVITNNKIYNKDRLDRFIKNTNINAKNRIEDNITIVQYTIEGDPIITELSYKIKDETYEFKGEQVNRATYVLKIDNTRDKFAAESDRKITINDNIPGQFFGIVEEKNGKNVNIKLILYAMIQYVDANVKEYEEINVCSYPSKAKIENYFKEETEIKQKANEIYGNDYCNTDHSVEAGGDALTDWECKLCGQTATNPTTNTPEICEECSKITGRCNKCGKLERK